MYLNQSDPDLFAGSGSNQIWIQPCTVVALKVVANMIQNTELLCNGPYKKAPDQGKSDFSVSTSQNALGTSVLPDYLHNCSSKEKIIDT